MAATSIGVGEAASVAVVLGVAVMSGGRIGSGVMVTVAVGVSADMDAGGNSTNTGVGSLSAGKRVARKKAAAIMATIMAAAARAAI